MSSETAGAILELRGALGYQEIALPRWQPRNSFPRLHVVIELGSDDRRWRHGWHTVGLVVFDSQGRRLRSKVDGMAAHLVEMQVREERAAAGIAPEDQSNDAVLGQFVARYVATITDFGILDSLRQYPQHLPIPTLAVLRVSELRERHDRRNVSAGWDHYVED